MPVDVLTVETYLPVNVERFTCVCVAQPELTD